MNDIEKIFSDTIRKWRMTDSQRAIFGVNMPQTQRAIKELFESLKTVFSTFPTFSLVKKDQTIEIVVKNTKEEEGAPSLTNIPINIPSLPSVFTQLMVNSITLCDGITEEELKEFFIGLSMKAEEIERQGGLKEFLEAQRVTHIKLDQLKFQLLKDEEQIVTGKGIPSKGTKETEKQKGAKVTRLHESIWMEYLSGHLDADNFKNRNEDLISTSLENPKQFEKILKRMFAKQKEAEKFLAHLEEKLFEAGFPKDAVAALKKKLLKPKKVLVPEDELARLRKIEKEYEKNADKRINGTLESIDIIKKKLTDETARSEAILHQMSQGGVVLDANGNIVSINATAQKILGISEAESHGKSMQDILKKHHLLTTVSDWQSETETHTPKEVKVQVSDDETLSIIRESAIVIQNEDGRSIGVVSALQNVTQQEELNKRKNDILDVLGHDLRAPLGAIKQNFEVLVASTKLDEECNEQQKKFLNNCKNNITRMGKLIEKIMDMRQLETGKIMLKYDTIETNQLLEEAVNSLTEWAQNKKIKLEVNAEKLPDIDGDPERLYQVITNFVSNALKFTPEEGRIVTTGKLVKNKGVQYVEISVKDSGMGIDKDNLEKIFDKYKQVTQNTPKGVSGLGLGLSICKMVVELHNGSIWADSELNSGSTFTFQIPVAQLKNDEDGTVKIA